VQAPSLSDFAGHVDRPFEATAGAVRATLTLTEATALPGGAPGYPSPFSLVFRGPSQPRLAQGTYELAHPRLGPLAMFIVPIGADETGVQYQAIFS
jgi:hypothetical protein